MLCRVLESSPLGTGSTLVNQRGSLNRFCGIHDNISGGRLLPLFEYVLDTWMDE